MDAKNALCEDSVDDFNDALSLVMVASSLETVSSVDDAVHLRNLCRVAATKLCQIRNRLNPDGIEVQDAELLWRHTAKGA